MLCELHKLHDNAAPSSEKLARQHVARRKDLRPEGKLLHDAVAIVPVAIQWFCYCKRLK